MLKDLFPTGQIYEGQLLREDQILLYLENGQEWLLDRADLSQRELALLDQFRGSRLAPSNPWQSYLAGRSKLPQDLGKICFLHLATDQTDKEQDWLSILASALPSYQAHFTLDAGRHILVLDASLEQDIIQVLTEIFPALEYDFEIRIQALIGHTWSHESVSQWPQFYRYEENLFRSQLAQDQPFSILSFSQLLLSHLSRQEELPPLFMKELAASLRSVDQLEETAQVMWRQAAVLTKTAQELYVHRNTLQHRLDRFHDETGFNLRNMDDLALVHMILIGFS